MKTVFERSVCLTVMSYSLLLLFPKFILRFESHVISPLFVFNGAFEGTREYAGALEIWAPFSLPAK